MSEEVFRSAHSDLTLVHRVIRGDDGKFRVEYPIVSDKDEIEEWEMVGGGPGLPDPTYDTLGEAIAFIDGMEDGLQGLHAQRMLQDENEQHAYDEGLKFGLALIAEE